jgi:RNA polymerase sigma factor (sigma-70 family)
LKSLGGDILAVNPITLTQTLPEPEAGLNETMPPLLKRGSALPASTSTTTLLFKTPRCEEELIKLYTPMVKSVCKTFACAEKGDSFSTAMMALIKAWRRCKNYQTFPAFAKRVVVNALIDEYTRKACKETPCGLTLKQEVPALESFDDEILQVVYLQMLVGDFSDLKSAKAPEEFEEIDGRDLIEGHLHAFLKTLPSEERFCFWARIIRETPLEWEAMMRFLGRSRSCVGMRTRSAVQKARLYFQEFCDTSVLESGDPFF